MKLTKTYLLLLLVLLSVCISILLLTFMFRKDIRNLRGGKWATNQQSCITQSCYQQGDCGIWYAPVHWCTKLTVGDSLAATYFWLSERSGKPPYQRPPQHYTGTLTWNAHPVSGRIHIQFVEGKISSINCSAKP